MRANGRRVSCSPRHPGPGPLTTKRFGDEVRRRAPDVSAMTTHAYSLLRHVKKEHAHLFFADSFVAPLCLCDAYIPQAAARNYRGKPRFSFSSVQIGEMWARCCAGDEQCSLRSNTPRRHLCGPTLGSTGRRLQARQQAAFRWIAVRERLFLDLQYVRAGKRSMSLTLLPRISLLPSPSHMSFQSIKLPISCL